MTGLADFPVPTNPPAERGYLAALVEGDERAYERLPHIDLEQDFTGPDPPRICRSVLRLGDQGMRASPQAVLAELIGSGEVSGWVSVPPGHPGPVLAELLRDTPRVGDVDWYLAEIIAATRRRVLRRIGLRLASAASTGTLDELEFAVASVPVDLIGLNSRVISLMGGSA